MGKAATFRYINMEGDNLSPEKIAENSRVALDIALGVHRFCEMALESGSPDGELFQVIHAAMEKIIEVESHLFYDWNASEVEGEE